MERIRCILLLVAILSSTDAILKNDPQFVRRYGGPNKRPMFNPMTSGSYSAPSYAAPPATGHFNYNPPSTYPTSTGYGNPGPYQTANYGPSYQPPTSSLGPPPNPPSMSYVRPFGFPEGQRFQGGGYTFKLPQVPPPRPPVKALYISKPYPDYVIRFKSPTYPAQVGVVEKPAPPPSYPAPPAMPAPIYAPSGPIKSPIPIYENPLGSDKQVVTVVASNQDVNVGTSYQTGAPNTPQSAIPVYTGVVPPSLPQYFPGQPPSTSAVYVISNDRLSNDNRQTGVNKQKAPAFVELSKEPAFGSNPQSGVIRPLTPDIVYSPNDPNNGAEFKPMYLFGPVFFPKPGGGEAKDSVGSGSVKSELKSAVPGDAAPVAAVVTVTNQTVTNSDVNAAVESVVDEHMEASDGKDASSSSGGGSGGGRGGGLLGVVESILGLDDASDDHDDGLSRADEEEEEEDEPVSPDVEAESTSASKSSSDRDSEGNPKRKSKPKSKSRTKTRYSSSSRRKNRNKPKTSGTRQGFDQPAEELETAEDKERGDDRKAQRRPTAAVKDTELQSSPDYGEANEQVPSEEEPEPVIGPVQIGYIGRPPDGFDYNPNQPFFYPAGIPPFSASNGPHPMMAEGQHSNSEEDVPSSTPNIRRHFDGAEATENTLIHDGSHPQDASPSDLLVAPTAELEQPQPQEVSVFDGSSSEGVSGGNVPEIVNRPHYVHNYPSYYDTGVSGSSQAQDQLPSPSSSQDASVSHSSSLHQSDGTSSAHQQPDSSISSGILDVQEPTSTAYADGNHAANGDYEHTPSSQLQVDQDISGTVIHGDQQELSSDANVIGDSLDKQGASLASTQYDYTSIGASADQGPASSESAHDGGSPESSTLSAPSSYSSISRRPFPSFHHYRVGYRPKYNRNYVPPTTYRPAYRAPTSTAGDDKDAHLGEEADSSATLYNSLHYDISTTVDTPTVDFDAHFNFSSTSAAPVTKPYRRGSVRYGDKISGKPV